MSTEKKTHPITHAPLGTTPIPCLSLYLHACFCARVFFKCLRHGNRNLKKKYSKTYYKDHNSVRENLGTTNDRRRSFYFKIENNCLLLILEITNS
jgi:hypothetical protein